MAFSLQLLCGALISSPTLARRVFVKNLATNKAKDPITKPKTVDIAAGRRRCLIRKDMASDRYGRRK